MYNKKITPGQKHPGGRGLVFRTHMHYSTRMKGLGSIYEQAFAPKGTGTEDPANKKQKLPRTAAGEACNGRSRRKPPPMPKERSGETGVPRSRFAVERAAQLALQVSRKRRVYGLNGVPAFVKSRFFRWCVIKYHVKTPIKNQQTGNNSDRQRNRRCTGIPKCRWGYTRPTRAPRGVQKYSRNT